MLAWYIGLPSRPSNEATAGMPPIFSAAMSWPVITARTPGILVAAATSTFWIVACATDARTNAA